MGASRFNWRAPYAMVALADVMEGRREAWAVAEQFNKEFPNRRRKLTERDVLRAVERRRKTLRLHAPREFVRLSPKAKQRFLRQLAAILAREFPRVSHKLGGVDKGD